MVNKFYESFVLWVNRLGQSEFKKILLLQSNIFLIISVLLILKPFSTSVMLKRYGVEILPIAFGCIAVAAVLIHLLVIFIKSKTSLFKAIQLNTIAHIAILSIVSALLYMGKMTDWGTVVIYVYVSLFALVTVTLFYQYCQSMLTIREAKRVLGYIGAGAIAGGVFGGYYASIVVRYLGNIGLLMSSVLFLLLTLIIMGMIHREFYSKVVEPKDDNHFEGGSILYTLKNKHVRNMAFIIGLGVVASKLVDYQFNSIAHEYYIDEADLTSFLGFWFSNINVIGFCIQLFFINIVLDRFGVINTISILPILLTLGLVTLIIAPVIGTAVFIKLIDGSLKQSVYKTSTEINIMALPTSLRSNAKTLIDVVIDSVATGVAGLLIFWILRDNNLSLAIISYTTIFVILIWIVFIFRSKYSYLNELGKKVNDKYNEPNDDNSPASINDLGEFIKGTRIRSLDRIEKLIHLINTASPKVKHAALSRIFEEFGEKAVDILSPNIKQMPIPLRKKYFINRLSFVHSINEMDDLMTEIDKEDQMIVTSALAKVINGNVREQKVFGIKRRIIEMRKNVYENSTLPKIFNRLYLKAVADARLTSKYDDILQGLKSDDNELQSFALFAIKNAKLKSLFNATYDTEVDESNLSKWYRTIATFPKLLITRIENDKDDIKNLKRRIPALAYVSRQTHLNYLYMLTDHPNSSVNAVALNSIGLMKKNFPTLNYKKRKSKRRLKIELNQAKRTVAELALLHDFLSQNKDGEEKWIEGLSTTLKKQLKQQLRSVFTHLRIITEIEELGPIYSALKNGDKSSALDYLDQILPYKTRKEVIPVIELTLSDEFDQVKLNKYKIRPTSIQRIKKRHKQSIKK